MREQNSASDKCNDSGNEAATTGDTSRRSASQAGWPLRQMIAKQEVIAHADDREGKGEPWLVSVEKTRPHDRRQKAKTLIEQLREVKFLKNAIR